MQNLSTIDYRFSSLGRNIYKVDVSHCLGYLACKDIAQFFDSALIMRLKFRLYAFLLIDWDSVFYTFNDVD